MTQLRSHKIKTEPIAHPDIDPHHKKDDVVHDEDKDIDNALDEALEESFPASDPVAINIANPKPVEKT